MNIKEQGFISWLSKLFNIEDPDQLDTKIKSLSEQELNNLANKFNTEVWPIMEKEMKTNNTISARYGSKLDFIIRLNGSCPEGYEVEKYKLGNKICTKCHKKEAMMKSSTMDSIKNEIESKKCGGKTKKKKMQDGGKYNENEHATLIEKYRKGQIKKGSAEESRLGELNRTSGHHEDGWEPKKLQIKQPTKEQAQKAKENIKKHLNGGIIQKYKSGRPISNVGTSDPIALWGKTENPVQLSEIVVTASKNPLGGGLYEWMIKNGLQSLTSFNKRKKYAQQWGIDNYTGTAEQNALLQKMLEYQLALAEASNNTKGLRKGLDY